MWNVSCGRGEVSEPVREGCSQDECAGLYPDRFYRNVSPSLRLSTFGCACACLSRTRDIVATQCDPEIESVQTQLVDTMKNHCVDTVRNSGYWL